MRFCTSTAQVDTYCKRVESSLPQGGKVNILQFTDKQYERIVSFHGKAKQPANKTPDQFDLFQKMHLVFQSPETKNPLTNQGVIAALVQTIGICALAGTLVAVQASATKVQTIGICALAGTFPLPAALKG